MSFASIFPAGVPAAGAFAPVKLDASGEGCSGMYWRKSKAMSSGTPRAPDGEDWPRNGTILEAAPAGEAEGVNWVVFKNGMFMPTMQAGVQVVWAASK